MKRVLLFLLTNIAVLLVLSLTLRLLGFEGFLAQNGVDLALPQLLLFAAVFGMGGSFVSLAMSKWIAKRATGAQVITDPRSPAEQWLVETVRQQAQAAGIGMPEVAIFPAAEPNAFATGARRDAALVAVSTGLLERMDRAEVEAVLGHEVSHVANGDMVTLALIQGVVNTFVLFLSRVIGHVVDRAVFRTEEGHGPGFWIVTIVAQLLLGILASIVVFWFSRRREFRADAGGARLAGAPSMIAALERLRAVAGGPETMPDSLRAFGIRGGRRPGWMRLFASHPPLEERIAALRRTAA
ncbi:MAG: protease HtpX [Deltaproteobacteria bacterium]|nr:protease HtpX [Deltaproteobacteria bacterium]